ncbi:hypothetical protein O1M54_43420 [Streptomyces diastatochromogenes]|nr:hypothetical protein [Streptomyces diastatochromogenes]
MSKEDKRGPEQPTASPTVGRDTELPARSSRLDGVRNQDLDVPEESADEDAAESDSASEVEVGGGEASAWDTKLQPEDFLPEQDPDLSGVPTADASQDAAAGGASLPTSRTPVDQGRPGAGRARCRGRRGRGGRSGGGVRGRHRRGSGDRALYVPGDGGRTG